jgi:hypothetical protein
MIEIASRRRATLVAALGFASLPVPFVASAQVGAGYSGAGRGAAGAQVPGHFIASEPVTSFSMRLDAGATARLLRGDGIWQATAMLSLGGEAAIGGFYGVAEFGGGERFAGGRAYSGAVSALFQRPFDWFRAGGGLGLAYHTFELGPGAWAYEMEGFLQLTAEIDPFGLDNTWSPYVSVTGRAGGLFAGAASNAFFPAAYAAGLAIGVRLDP